MISSPAIISNPKRYQHRQSNQAPLSSAHYQKLVNIANDQRLVRNQSQQLATT